MQLINVLSHHHMLKKYIGGMMILQQLKEQKKKNGPFSKESAMRLEIELNNLLILIANQTRPYLIPNKVLFDNISVINVLIFCCVCMIQRSYYKTNEMTILVAFN